MQVTDFPNLAPSVCFICESAPPCRYVDTGRSFERPAVTTLDGRKYLCEECVRDAAHVLGVFDAERGELRHRIAELIDSANETGVQLARAQAIIDARFEEFLPKQSRQKPGPKPKAAE
jgi:hypothetical protein